MKDYRRVEQIWNRLAEIQQMNPSDKALVDIYMGSIRVKQKRYAEAEAILGLADSIVILNDRPLYFSTLSELYRQKGDPTRALAYKDSIILYKDSIVAMANNGLIDATRTQLEVLKFSEEMENDLENMRRRNLIVAFSSLALVLFGLVVILFLRFRLMRSRDESRMASLKLVLESQERAMAEERLKVTEMEAQIEQEKLRNSIEEQEIHLNASSTFITAKNNLVQSLIDEIDKSGETKRVPEVSALYTRLRSLARTSQIEYENLLTNFERANPVFFRKLKDKHPELTQGDLKFLALIRMNMSIKDISGILNINPESCKRRKIRLSKKLGIDNSANLFTYVLSI